MNLIEYKLQHIIRTEERKRRRLSLEDEGGGREEERREEVEEDMVMLVEDGVDMEEYDDQQAASLNFAHSVSYMKTPCSN